MLAPEPFARPSVTTSLSEMQAQAKAAAATACAASDAAFLAKVASNVPHQAKAPASRVAASHSPPAANSTPEAAQGINFDEHEVYGLDPLYDDETCSQLANEGNDMNSSA